MKKKILTEYDQTKKMLNVLRKTAFSGMIKEQTEAPTIPAQKTDVSVINDVDIKLASGDKLDLKISKEEKYAISQLIDNFRQQVSQIVDFEPGFTISDRQVRLDGTLTDEDISFVYIAGEEGGLYINADMLELKTELLDVFEKLIKFADMFKTAMEPLIKKRTTN